MRKLFLLLIFLLIVSVNIAAADAYRHTWPEDEDLFSQYYKDGEFFPVQEAEIGSTLDSVTTRLRELKVPYEIRYNRYGWTTEIDARMNFGAYRNFSLRGGSMYFDKYGYLGCITSRIDTEDSFSALYDVFYSQFGGADKATQTCMEYDTDFESYAEFESTTFALWIRDEALYELEVRNSERAEFDYGVWSGRELDIDDARISAYFSVYDIRMLDSVLERYE